MNLPPLGKLSLWAPETAPTGDDAALKYLKLASEPTIEELNFTREEALEYLELVAVATKKKLRHDRVHGRMHNNVEHYLIGDYTKKHHASMFGGPGYFAADGVAVFWENFIMDYRLAPWGGLWYPSYDIKLRFANNNGPNFRDHRQLALKMFRASYKMLKQRKKKAKKKAAAHAKGR